MTLFSKTLAVVAAALLPHFALAADPPEADDVPQKIGFLTAALSYHSNYGPQAKLGLNLDLGNSQLGLEVERFKDATAFGIDWRSSEDRARNPRFGLALGARKALADTVYNFDQTEQFIRPSLTWDLANSHEMSAYVALSSGKIKDVADTTSALVQVDEGSYVSHSAGLAYVFQQAIAGQRGSYRLEMNAELGETSLDHDFLVLKAVARKHYTLSDTMLLSGRFSVGHIESLSGTSAINQRYLLGPTTLRGFAFGGIGPKDLTTSPETPLGGNDFATLQLDLKFLRAGLLEGRLTPGLFADFGSVWSLDDVGQPALVDDGFKLRSAVGLSVDINTQIGPIRLSVARPVHYQSHDQRQSFSVSFQARF